MNKDFFSKERFKYIIILALFNYIFLGTEYLFDNIVGDIKPQSVVTAQSYILGASVLGFLFFAIIKKYSNYSEPHSQNRIFDAYLLLMWLLRHINCVKYAYK